MNLLPLQSAALFWRYLVDSGFWLQIVAMLVDISPKVDQVTSEEDDRDDASVCPSDLDIKTADAFNLELAETDGNRGIRRRSSRKSIHSYRRTPFDDGLPSLDSLFEVQMEDDSVATKTPRKESSPVLGTPC